MHPALEAIRRVTEGTSYEGALWLVGGAVRDELLGRPLSEDFDLVLEADAGVLVEFLFQHGIAETSPTRYARFGTAMLRIEGVSVEFVTARRESYVTDSRKPEVEAASLLEDAMRRDFTVNTLLRNLHTGALRDPLGQGVQDLEARVLRTPLDPVATFHDDPLRMLRAVRFCQKLDFRPAEGLFEAIRKTAPRLSVVSAERIRDEFLKILLFPDPSPGLRDLLETGLLEVFAPELAAMDGVEQGDYHHLDVWGHTLLVVRQTESERVLRLAALLHDVGKPVTRHIDEAGRTRFFKHEAVGAAMASELLERLRLPSKEIEEVALLVKSHMRLGSASPFSDAAARRLIRDLGPLLPRLLRLVEADTQALKRGVKPMDLAPLIAQIVAIEEATPAEALDSPLDGAEIIAETGAAQGPEVGRLKRFLREKVLAGELRPGDKEGARALLRRQKGV